VTAGEIATSTPVTVVVGVDGSGRSHRLEALAAAAGGTAVRVDPGTPIDRLPELLATAAGGGPVLVDDAHRLSAQALAAVLAAVRAGTPAVIARGPSIPSAELAALDAELAARGSVELLRPLDETEVAALLPAAEAGRAPSVLAASCGRPAVAALLAAAPDATTPPALVARVQRQLAVLPPEAASVARVLALRLDRDDAVLADVAGLDLDRLAAAAAALHDAGLLDPNGDRMIPAIADALTTQLPPAQLRLVHDAVARRLPVGGPRDLLPVATRMRDLRVRTPAAAEFYLAVAQRLRLIDPSAALAWSSEALEAGLPPDRATAVRAEAAAMLGRTPDVEPVPPDTAAEDDDETLRLHRVAGALAAQQGRAGRAADLLMTGGPLGQLLAVPSLVGVGLLDIARETAHTKGPVAARRLAEACVAAARPSAAVPLFIEAAEQEAVTRPAWVPADTAAALAAPIAVLAGDAATAETLLTDALRRGTGGPAAAARHRLLLAWVRLRAGRFDTAVGELADRPDRADRAEDVVPGRDRLVVAALQAGLARRSGDVARLRNAWAGVEQALARRAVDLFQTEMLEELLVAAVRLRQPQRIDPVLGVLEAQLEGLGRPVVWAVALNWLRLQLAVAADDADAVVAQAERLRDLEPPAGRQRAQRVAAQHWAQAFSGRVDVDALGASLDALAFHQLPWEASRLAGQAAIRVTDAGLARRLLERARELSSAEVQLDVSRSAAPPSGLSEREIEVAQLVVAGRTHREIGSQLFLSPKTVEHHVARIRTKLGATTRAEFLAALRTVLGEHAAT
jgi:DNA-binding CsgD family transcriptional regulator